MPDPALIGTAFGSPERSARPDSERLGPSARIPLTGVSTLQANRSESADIAHAREVKQPTRSLRCL